MYKKINFLYKSVHSTASLEEKQKIVALETSPKVSFYLKKQQFEKK